MRKRREICEEQGAWCKTHWSVLNATRNAYLRHSNTAIRKF